MSNPTVAAVMLVNGREAMVRKSVECWTVQTARPSLLILDSSPAPIRIKGGLDGKLVYVWMPDMNGKTIGELRNAASWCAAERFDADIIAHLDSDDWSHPRRIEEQVALLQATGADVVGYDRMLFWRESGIGKCPNGTSAGCGICKTIPCVCDAQSWLYIGEILGTSLCCWRKTWEATPFRGKGWHNEDYGFVTDVKGRGGNVVAISSVDSEPRMIARIHAQNSQNASYQTLETHPHHWRRVPEWDIYCEERMAL